MCVLVTHASCPTILLIGVPFDICHYNPSYLVFQGSRELRVYSVDPPFWIDHSSSHYRSKPTSTHPAELWHRGSQPFSGSCRHRPQPPLHFTFSINLVIPRPRPPVGFVQRNVEASSMVLQCAQDIDDNSQTAVERRGDQMSSLHFG